MFVWWGTSAQTRRVKGGRKERAFCPECGEDTTFVEVEVREAITLFSVIDLVDDTERAFRCVDCDAVGQLVESHEAAAVDLSRLSPEAARRLEAARDAERARRDAEERQRRERARRQREAQADIDLAALKAKMGLAGPADAVVNDEPPVETVATDKRPWWKIWGR